MKTKKSAARAEPTPKAGLIPLYAVSGKVDPPEVATDEAVAAWAEALRGRYAKKGMYLTVHGVLNAAAHCGLNGKEVRVRRAVKEAFTAEYAREKEVLRGLIRLGSVPATAPTPPPEPVKNKAGAAVGASQTASGRTKFVFLGNLSLSDVVKYLAANKVDRPTVYKVLAALGCKEPPKNTIDSRFYAASKGNWKTFGPLPQLTKAQSDQLKKLAKEVK
jgi:hypothetical protein